jgi:hypothetical protein
MPDPSSLLSAIAASVAAVLAGLNLYFSGRREHSRWARESLVEAFVTYLSASFDVGKACSGAIRQRSGGVSVEDLKEQAEQTERTLHEIQMTTLTRIRLLSTQRVTEAAQALHGQDHAYLTLAFEETDLPSTDKIAAVKAGLSSARERMINEARQALSLRGRARFEENLP